MSSLTTCMHIRGFNNCPLFTLLYVRYAIDFWGYWRGLKQFKRPVKQRRPENYSPFSEKYIKTIQFSLLFFFSALSLLFFTIWGNLCRESDDRGECVVNGQVVFYASLVSTTIYDSSRSRHMHRVSHRQWHRFLTLCTTVNGCCTAHLHQHAEWIENEKRSERCKLLSLLFPLY